MRDYQRIVSAIIIACSIIIAGMLVSEALGEASGIIGSQISAAIAHLRINS